MYRLGDYCIHTHIIRQVDMREDERIIPDADPRHDTDLDACAAIIADKGSQFVAAGINHRIADFDFDVFGIETPIGRSSTGAK